MWDRSHLIWHDTGDNDAADAMIASALPAQDSIFLGYSQDCQVCQGATCLCVLSQVESLSTGLQLEKTKSIARSLREETVSHSHLDQTCAGNESTIKTTLGT